MSSAHGNGTSSNNRVWATASSRRLARRSYGLVAGRTSEHPRSTTTTVTSSSERSPPPASVCRALPSDSRTAHRHGRVPPAPPPKLRSRPNSLRWSHRPAPPARPALLVVLSDATVRLGWWPSRSRVEVDTRSSRREWAGCTTAAADHDHGQREVLLVDCRCSGVRRGWCGTRNGGVIRTGRMRW